MAWPNPPATWSTSQVVSASDLNTQLRDALIAILPTGTLIMCVAAYSTVETAYEGRWLQCNGVAVSRSTYSVLFAYLNSMTPALPFGVGNGTTTFNLPDMRGRTVFAQGAHTQVDTLGDSDGVALADRSPSHWHGETVLDGGGGGAPLRGGNNVSYPDAAATSGNPNLKDNPAFLVVGSYFIKYT